MYLTAAEDKDRLELVRHKVRQIADLTSRLEALEQEKKELEQILTLRDSHIQELKEHVQLLMEKNHAKQEVIMALTEQMARELSDPLQEANTITVETLYKQQEEIEHLKVCEMAQVFWAHFYTLRFSGRVFFVVSTEYTSAGCSICLQTRGRREGTHLMPIGC